MATRKTTYVTCINSLASHALIASSLTETSSFFTPRTRVRRARISTDKIFLGRHRRSLSWMRHHFINGRASARLLDSGACAYAVTFDRETFDDATERIVKYTPSLYAKKIQARYISSESSMTLRVSCDRSRVLRDSSKLPHNWDEFVFACQLHKSNI